jgi:hypothetical protein
MVANQSGDLLLSLSGRAAIARWARKAKPFLGVKRKFLTIDPSQ